MSFTTPAFFAFLLGCCLLHYILPAKWQNLLLLAASVYFVANVGVSALAVLCVELAVTYCAALLMQKYPGRKKLWLGLGVGVCVALLAGLKYLGMLLQTAALLWPALGQVQLTGIAALGISYYTLMAIGYLADVAGGRQQAEKNLLHFALYLSFFPQITCGPVGRAGRLLPQFKQPRRFDYELFSTGATRMLLGYFKKLVIADGLALAVDPVYADPAAFSGPAVILATVLYAYQLYCDFSGYTDIARGAGELFGIRLDINFRRPYLAHNMAEFWQRWHISLSQWFMDYLYNPVAWCCSSPAVGAYVGMVVVFSVSGLWHGAAWTYVVWGLLHALYRVVGAATKKSRRKLYKKLGGFQKSRLFGAGQILTTFALVCFSYIFFRAASLENAGLVIQRAFADWAVLLQPARLVPQLKAMSIGRKLLAYLSVSVLFIECADWLAERKKLEIPQLVRSLPAVWRYVIYYSLLLMILFFGQLGSSSFIYFQF